MSTATQKVHGHMVQYGLLPNCTNKCDFCLRLDQRTLPLEDILERMARVRENISHVDWQGKFCRGISILGGEVYGLTDPTYQAAYLELIDVIVQKVLLPNRHRNCRYSTVTNGIYDPAFLFQVCDKIKAEVGLQALDVNFSYDLKYRYHKESDRLLALSNIQKFHDRYNYAVGVQMILTQHVIDSVSNGSWDMAYFLQHTIAGNQFVFLYPHPVNTGKKLHDFQFSRASFLKFLQHLEDKFPSVYTHTVSSTIHSSTFKYTGIFDPNKPATQDPVLADGKEILNPRCGHSVLYQCYRDTKACMLCDIETLS